MNISKQSPDQSNRDIRSVIFTDNERVAAIGPGWLAALKVEDSGITRISESSEPALFQNLYSFTVPLHRAPEGHIVVYRHELTFPQLELVRQVDLSNAKVSRDGSLIGIQNHSEGLSINAGTWCVSLYAAGSSCIATGSGRLLAVGRQGTVAETATSVRITDLQQSLLGEVKMGKACPGIADFVSTDEFLLTDCKDARLIGLDGKTHLKLGSFAFGEVRASDDGARLLFARHSRHASPLKVLGEDSVALLTLGVGVGDESNNRSLFTVIDRRTGRPCFRTLMKYPEGSTPPSTDISTDGRKVVIGFRDKVQVFRVPDACP